MMKKRYIQTSLAQRPGAVLLRWGKCLIQSTTAASWNLVICVNDIKAEKTLLSALQNTFGCCAVYPCMEKFPHWKHWRVKYHQREADYCVKMTSWECILKFLVTWSYKEDMVLEAGCSGWLLFCQYFVFTSKLSLVTWQRRAYTIYS